MKKNLLFLTVLASTILIANLVFAWTSPTTDPPGGNLPAPLNVGSDTQTKSGGLNIQGNVGIGTTSPGYKLDVSGDIRSTGTVRAGKGNFGFAPNGNGWTGFDLRGTGKRIILGVDDNSGNNVFDIEKVDSGWTHMMELWKNGGAYFAGNVGIGTTNPGAKLEVTAGSAVTTGIKTEGYIEDVSGNVSKNYTSSHSWTAGTTGSIGIFGQNGSTSENSRVWGMGPRGNRVILWKAVGDTTSGPDGGWNTSLFTIDNTKMYRFSVWIKKSVTTDGTTYFGTGGSPSVLKTLSGDDNSNPYFWYGDLPQLDRWYLLVGYIHAYDDTDTTNYGGIYDGITGKKVAGTTDYKFASGTTQTRHRTYLYYSTSGTATQYWWDPRVEEVNGSEPTIESLLGLYKPATQGSDAYFGGNVGIGTTSPGEKLAVNGNIDVMSHKIVNLSTPTADTDAATKAYVDAASGGGCYTNYGGTDCATGYTAVLTGYTTTYYAVYSANWAAGSVECSSIKHHQYSGHDYYGTAIGTSYNDNGIALQDEPCAICCK